MTVYLGKKLYIFLFLFTIILFNATVQEDSTTDDDYVLDFRESIEHDLSGFVFQLSGWNNYFSLGLGLNWGNYTVSYGHFFATAYDFLLEYKTRNELNFRLFYNLYGGSGAMLLGASAVIATNFDEITVGVAPHIGIGFYTMNLFYRYNFHINNSFNRHEIVLKMYRPNVRF